MSSPNPKIRIDPSVIAQPVGEELVLLDMRSEIYLGLNPVGAVIWKFLEAGNPLEEIVSQLALAYPEMSKQQIAEDLQDLLIKLRGHKLISDGN